MEKNNLIFSIEYIKKYILIFFTIFLISLSILYSKYLDIVDEEVYETKVEVLNIYKKDDFDILRLKAKEFSFFTSIQKENDIKKLSNLNIAFVTKRVSFIDYLKGFYAKTIYFEVLEDENTLRTKLANHITLAHDDKLIQELFNALFLAIPISKDLRQICTNYGISHLIALSGFHLAVLSFSIYWLIYFPYSYFHKRYFPYRNKKFDISLLIIAVLFAYLLFTQIVPSLLRAFVMFVLGIYLLRSNIKLISFNTLLVTFLIIIAIFPKLFFSLGFWFSIIAVFYIFLYIKYFKKLSYITHLIFFNIWIFLVFNPIVHFYFPQTSYEQLLSPLITLGFTIFYPFEIVAHLFDFSSFFDEIIIRFLNHKIDVFELKTPIWFFCVYLLVSIVSVFKKYAFYILNILLILFNLLLYI